MLTIIVNKFVTIIYSVVLNFLSVTLRGYLFGTTVILMETIVERDGRPKSGVGRKDFQHQQFLLLFIPALTFYSF